jgi:hypothetical protein
MTTPLLNVEGVEVRLSTFDNAQMCVADGGLRVSLKNYTGDLIFITKVGPVAHGIVIRMEKCRARLLRAQAQSIFCAQENQS